MKRELYQTHLFVFGVLLVMVLTSTLYGPQNALTDFRFQLFPRKATGEVVLVAIDPKSIEAIGIWPWPRTVYADLLGKLQKAGASEIAFDVDFSAISNSSADQSFAHALKKAGGGVILPVFKQYSKDRDGQSVLHINNPLSIFRNWSWLASVNIVTEPNGLVRRYSYGETIDRKFYPSIAALLAGVYKNDETRFQLDYSIRTETIPVVSFVDILDDSIDPQRLRGKKIIVGGTAIELGDRFHVPNIGMIVGPQLQALAAETILQDRMLYETGMAVSLVGLAGLVLLMWTVWSRLGFVNRLLFLSSLALIIECSAAFVQANMPFNIVTSPWLVAIALYFCLALLDEIDFRKLIANTAQQRFQKICSSLGEGVVCTDEKGIISVWNQGAEVIFGYEPHEIIGCPIDVLWRASGDADAKKPFSLADIPENKLRSPGGRLTELVGVQKSGETFALEACFSAWPDRTGLHYGAIMRDISVRKREEKKIRFLAEHDTLTGLANRNKLNQTLKNCIAQAADTDGEVVLLLMDLDNFKDINDTLGHASGDVVLRKVARTLKKSVATQGLVARLGGDEFAIVLNGADAVKRACKLSSEITESFGNHATIIDGQRFLVTTSIGLAIYPRDGRTEHELLANADLALYRAKETERGTHVLFRPEFRKKLEIRRALEIDLTRAVEKNEFELFYQPQVSLTDGKIVGVEALIRWRHPDRGLVSPDEFIAVLNDGTLSDRVGRWVLETACWQGQYWRESGHNLRIGVNLSPSQLQSDQLPHICEDVLAKTNFLPSLLELEVTENILLDKNPNVTTVLRQIRDMGIGTAFDDFGTGYASLSYLKRFPLDRIKIDRSFVSDILTDPEDAAIVRAIIGLGVELGQSVIAEGIEDTETAEYLLQHGCDEGQGYYFGRPMTATDLQDILLSPKSQITSDPAAGTKQTSAA